MASNSNSNNNMNDVMKQLAVLIHGIEKSLKDSNYESEYPVDEVASLIDNLYDTLRSANILRDLLTSKGLEYVGLPLNDDDGEIIKNTDSDLEDGDD